MIRIRPSVSSLSDEQLRSASKTLRSNMERSRGPGRADMLQRLREVRAEQVARANATAHPTFALYRCETEEPTKTAYRRWIQRRWQEWGDLAGLPRGFQKTDADCVAFGEWLEHRIA